MKTLERLFTEYTGQTLQSARLLTAAGSNRSYYRMTGADGRQVIGVAGTSADENRAFLTIGRHLYSQDIAVPEILAVSDCGMYYLQQDLGDTSLFSLLDGARQGDTFDDGVMSLLEQTVSALPDLQFKGGEGLDFSVCFPCQSFDRRSILWDLNYFKYCFLKGSGLEFHEAMLEDDFERLADMLLADSPYSTFMFRDFQARNVMIHNNMPWFIDFQGGRRGPVEYDLVSFLWQARAAYSDSVKSRLTDVFLESLARYRKVDRGSFLERMRLFAVMRTLQVLGAYGYRGYFERKAHFLQSVPAAMNNLRGLTDVLSGTCPYLCSLLTELAALPQFNRPMPVEDGRLTIRITSFSYRKGIPDDLSGNGGGFVFDCRSMHNPGLYDQYKQLNGTDRPVMDFLETEGEVQKYLDNVYGLVEPAVDKYLKRGFTSLMVSFGCTGGHHRSVYCASHLAEHLHEKYGERVHILLEHREHNIHREL